MVSENFDIEFQSGFDELMKARSGYYKDNSMNRHLGRVGVPYGSKKNFIDDELVKFNDRFNKELDRYKNGEMNVNEVVHLGRAKGILAEFIPNSNEIIMRQRVVTKGTSKKHNVDTNAIKNLPILISDPLMIFKKDIGGLGILIRVKDRDDLNVFVAIHFEQNYIDQENKSKAIFIVNEIKSFHGRELENIIKPIVENKSLVWVNKKDSLDWISSARANSLQEISNKDYLSDAVNIIRKFENANKKDNELNIIKDKLRKSSSSKLQSNSAEVRGTTLRKSSTIFDGPNSSNNMDSARHNPLISSSALSLPKDTTNTNDMQQFMDEIIEKSKKGAPIGTERTYSNGKTYVRANLLE